MPPRWTCCCACTAMPRRRCRCRAWPSVRSARPSTSSTARAASKNRRAGGSHPPALPHISSRRIAGWTFRAKLCCIAVAAVPCAWPAARSHAPRGGQCGQPQQPGAIAFDSAGRGIDKTALSGLGDNVVRAIGAATTARERIARTAGLRGPPTARGDPRVAGPIDRGGTRVRLATLDIAIVLAYLAGIFILAQVVSREKAGHQKSASDYFLASRSLPWWAIGASLIAANISAEQIIGMSGSGYAIGLAIASYEWMAAATLLIVGKFFLPIF